MKRRGWMKLGIFGVVASGVIAAAGSAFARHRGGGCGGRGEWMKTMVHSKVDDALDSAKVTGAARETVHGEVDKVIAAFQSARGGRDADVDSLLDAFAGDSFDKGAVDSIRTKRQADFEKVGQAIADALATTHDALTPEQRKALIEYVKTKRARWHGRGGD